MDSFKWVKLYQKGGLWGCFNEIASFCHSSGWLLWFECNRKSYCLASDGSSHSLNLSQIKSVEIISASEKLEVSIPIFSRGVVLFVLRFNLEKSGSEFMSESSEGFQKTWFNNVKFQVELFVSKEALETELYPSFLMSLFPFGPSLKSINSKINSEPNGLIFLNGQKGTGKATFFQCYVLFHFNRLIRFSALNEPLNILELDGTKTRKIFYIPEIAALTKAQQKEVVEKIEGHSDSLHIYMASIYEPDLLENNGILQNDLARHCSENRNILPSLSRRDSDILDILYFINKFKIYADNHFGNLEKLKSDEIDPLENLSGIYGAIHKFNSIESQLATNLLQSRREVNLREIVRKIEVELIELASKQTNSSQHQMAEFLGISRGSLQHKLRKYRLDHINLE